ncbi:MAG: hypothetical protein U5J96_15840 [Ignavibacteriaceae bacterium]|nr:hypothetical protein [Ignavibacteriaceae bacterium]
MQEKQNELEGYQWLSEYVPGMHRLNAFADYVVQIWNSISSSSILIVVLIVPPGFD